VSHFFFNKSEAAFLHTSEAAFLHTSEAAFIHIPEAAAEPLTTHDVQRIRQAEISA
jgi:hypothetical protein